MVITYCLSLHPACIPTMKQDSYLGGLARQVDVFSPAGWIVDDGLSDLDRAPQASFRGGTMHAAALAPLWHGA